MDICSVVRWVHVAVAFGKKRMLVFCAIDEKDYPGCYQSNGAEASSVMVSGMHQCPNMFD